MGDNDKPFVCTHTGCSMRFANEDHLGVHRLKHEMSLALTPGTKHGSFLAFADQTPTPTKFLKNCEEIGLFSELTKNPFEEAFKKASETLTDPKCIETLHVAMSGLENDSLNTPTPTQQLLVPHHTPAPIKEPEFIPLPGPDTDLGSTVGGSGSTPGSCGGSACGTPRSGARRTPAGTPTSSSTMGLPFKLKLKREPLGESELSMLPGGVVSSPSTPLARDLVKGPPGTPVAATVIVTPPTDTKVAVITHQTAPKVTMVTQHPPAKVAMVAPVMSSVGRVRGASVEAVEPTVEPHTVGDGTALTGNNVSPSSSSSSSRPPQYYLQVMIQMPSGEMMPVQIPAALSTATTTAATTSPALSRASSTAALPTNVTYSAPQARPAPPSLGSVMGTARPTGGAASSLTKQKLKAALQQSVLSSNLRVMSEAVDRVTGDPPQPSTPRGPPSLLLSPGSSSTQLSPDMEDFDEDQLEDDDEDEDDEDGMGGGNPKRIKMEDDPDDRRKKFLERNRAAAARCRQKKKMWITNLETKAEDLQNTNGKLQQEVTMLRSEVAQLKTLLLAHKDCPITLQLQSAGMMKPGIT